MTDSTRRTLLKLFAAGAALGWLPCRAQALAMAAEGWPPPEQLQEAFAAVVEGARQYWLPRVGAEKSQAMAADARAAFAALSGGLPDVGAAASPDAQYLPVAAWFVALYRPMKAAGMSAEDVGHIVYQLYQYQLAGEDPARLAAEGEQLFAGQAGFARWADSTERRQYPANWVARYVPGNGGDFDFGYDYSECAVVKYLRAQGVPELAAFVCPNDFLKSAAQGTGLVRHHTLAQGDDRCDFRFKKGRPVTQRWETEIVLIRERQKRFNPA